MNENWRYNSLEVLENDYWQKPIFNSNLVKRCHALRALPLIDFTVEDLRIMIGQQIGLKYLIPLAFEILTKDLFAEGDYYEGDLLQNVLRVDVDFWNNNKDHRETLYKLINPKRIEIIEREIDTSEFDQDTTN